MQVKWSEANAKTENLMSVPSIAQFLQNKRKVFSVDLLSGWSCPFAKDCLSKVVRIDGKSRIEDGPNTEFRCFSASQEALYPVVYNARKHNFDLFREAKTTAAMVALIEESMPKRLGICRIHVGGDMFNQPYFDAWLAVARNHSDRLFYCYTKNLPCWLRRRAEIDSLPNFVITASYGGKRDDLIVSEKLRYAQVVYSEIAAGKLPIDHDDSHAADPAQKDKSFALLIHGVQPKGSEAAEALKLLKGKGSYNRKGAKV